MDQRKTKAFFEGRDIHAYNIFGAHLEANGVRFRVYAPNAKNISVIGTFNNWDDQASKMKKDKRGIWECFVEGAKDKDSYKYRVWQANGELVDKMDPYAFYSELRPNTASIVSDLSYDGWTDKKWLDQRNKGFDSPVNIYEMHVGSWRKDDENEEFVQYHEIEKELIEHCKKHHFTHVEVMPLCEYPFDGSWGYQCTGYFSSTSRYGTNHELMHFVNALHEAGIGVIMDFVPVHFVKDNYALGMFDGTPLYEYSKPEDANSEWGTANFNLWKEEVRSFLMSAANFWIDVYHVDGLRMDAISNAIFWHGNKNNGVNEGACDFMKRMNHLLNEAHQGKIMLIAEDSSDFPNVTKPSYAGGLGFDYKWDMGWMNDTLDYFRIHPYDRKFHYHKLSFSMMYFYNEHYLLPFSHDEVVHGKGSLLNKMPGDYNQKFAGLRTFMGYMMTHPGKKLLFMGCEFGQFIEWDYHKQLDWMLLDYESHRKTKDYIRALNHYYLAHPALWQVEDNWDGFRWLNADDNTRSVITYYRADEKGKKSLVLCNFAASRWEDYRMGVPEAGTYRVALCSEEEQYGGAGFDRETLYRSEEQPLGQWAHSITLDVPPLSCMILEPINTEKE